MGDQNLLSFANIRAEIINNLFEMDVSQSDRFKIHDEISHDYWKGISRLCQHCSIQANRRCSACNITRYCSIECQRSDWPIHKRKCRALGRMNHRIRTNRLKNYSLTEKGRIECVLFLPGKIQSSRDYNVFEIIHQIFQVNPVKTSLRGIRNKVSKTMDWPLDSFFCDSLSMDHEKVRKIPITPEGTREVTIIHWKSYDEVFRKEGLIRDLEYLPPPFTFHKLEIILPPVKNLKELKKKVEIAKIFFQNVGMYGAFHLFCMGVIFFKRRKKVKVGLFLFEKVIQFRATCYELLQNIVFLSDEDKGEKAIKELGINSSEVKELLKTICRLYNILTGCCYYLDRFSEAMKISKKTIDIVRIHKEDVYFTETEKNELLIPPHYFASRIAMLDLDFELSKKMIKKGLVMQKKNISIEGADDMQIFDFNELEICNNEMESEYDKCYLFGERFEVEKYDVRCNYLPKVRIKKNHRARIHWQAERFLLYRRIQRRYYEEMKDLKNRVEFLRNEDKCSTSKVMMMGTTDRGDNLFIDFQVFFGEKFKVMKFLLVLK